MKPNAVVSESPNKKVPVHIQTTDEGIEWYRITNGLLVTSKLEWRQILPSVATESYGEECNLEVNYVVTSATNGCVTMRVSSMYFIADRSLCQELNRHICEGLEKHEAERPKKIILFLNPVAGNKDAMKNYTKFVKHIFELSQIDVDLIQTEYETHAENILEKYDLSEIDAVLSMGGDASFCQVLNGMMVRCIKDAGLVLDDVNSEPVKIPIRLGALPNGSGCVYAGKSFGTIDLETCAISIILGRSIPADVMEIRDSNQLVGYTCYAANSGSFCNAIHWIDSHRRFGKARYWIASLAIWWFFRTYNSKIEYLPVEDKEEYRRHTQVSDGSNSKTTFNDPLPEWYTYRGVINSFHMIGEHFEKQYSWPTFNSYTKPCLTGENFLMIIHKCKSFFELLKIYITGTGSKDFKEFKDLQCVPCTTCRITVSPDNNIKPTWLSLSSLYRSTEQTYTCRLFKKKFNILSIDHEMAEDAIKSGSQ